MFIHQLALNDTIQITLLKSLWLVTHLKLNYSSICNLRVLDNRSIYFFTINPQ